MLAAKGEAEKIRNVGAAEATAIEAIGKAEAEMMRMKAAAYKQYGDAAMMSLVLEALPKASYCSPIYSHLCYLSPLLNCAVLDKSLLVPSTLVYSMCICVA